MAYSSLFSLFPFLLFLRGLSAYVPGAEQLGDWVLAGLRNLISENSRLYQIVEENVFEEIGARSATPLSIGVVLTLWSASGAVMTLIKAVNLAYGLEETRSWFRRRPLAAAIAVVGQSSSPSASSWLYSGLG